MFIKIAWRNIWRHKRRSMIIISSIVIGVIALMLMDSISRGMMKQMLERYIIAHVSHIQIHDEGFENDNDVHKVVPEHKKIETLLGSTPFIKHYSKRVSVFGLLSSANASAGVAIIGIQPDKERNITDIHSKIISGKYLSGNPHEIVIGVKIAEKLEVEIGDKVVSVASDVDGNVSNELFRVAGIYKTSDDNFDKTYIYIPIQTAQKMLGINDGVHEFAMITNNSKLVPQYKDKLLKAIDGKYEILTFWDKMPMMLTWLDMYDQMIIIFYLIVGFAVLFGIVNIMLMAVFERVHEFGVLMSIGMKRTKVFTMVIQEAFMLGFVGTVIGFVLGMAIYYPLSVYGIDFSIYAESLSSYGLGSILYPMMTKEVIIYTFLTMPIVTVVGAIYPAMKAIRLQPTEAMRYV
ncbi:MAG: ABC transporter permease [bacterium]